MTVRIALLIMVIATADGTMAIIIHTVVSSAATRATVGYDSSARKPDLSPLLGAVGAAFCVFVSLP